MGALERAELDLHVREWDKSTGSALCTGVNSPMWHQLTPLLLSTNSNKQLASASVVAAVLICSFVHMQHD